MNKIKNKEKFIFSLSENYFSVEKNEKKKKFIDNNDSASF